MTCRKFWRERWCLTKVWDCSFLKHHFIFIYLPFYLQNSLKMASCMWKPNIYSFIDKKICFRSLFFVKIATMFKLLVILFIIKLLKIYKSFFSIFAHDNIIAHYSVWYKDILCNNIYSIYIYIYIYLYIYILNVITKRTLN